MRTRTRMSGGRMMPRRRYHDTKGVALDAAVAAAQGIWARRQLLAPTLVAAGTGPAALMAHATSAIVDGSTPYVATGGGLAIATAAAVAYAQPDNLRVPAYATVAALGATGIWAAIDPWAPHAWGVMGLSAMACQAAWLVGRAMSATDPNAKAKAKGEKLVEVAKWDGHVSGLSRTRAYTEWRISLGVGTRAASIKVSDVAHILGVTPDRVHVWPGSTSREVTIRVMNKRPSSKPSKHPALVAATADEWVPGTRSVCDPIPIGPSPAGLGDPVTMSPRPDGDVSHLLVAGMTGSGKSYSLAALLTGLMACGDVILAGADVPKAGQTLHPFRPAFARVSTTMDDLVSDLYALEKLSKERINRMNGVFADKWDPRVHGPLIVYVLEEWAATISEASEDKDTEDVAELVDRLAATVRSAGICLLVCTQRPDRESMGSTRLRSNIASAMIHKIAQRRDLMGLLPGEDLDLGVLTRKGDALIVCGSGGVVRGRAWMVDPADRHELATRYSERPSVTTEEAAILTAAGWTVSADDTTTAPTAPTTASTGTPDWAGDVLAGIEALPEADQDDTDADEDIDILGAIPIDAPAEVVMFGLVEALGDADRITTDDAVAALGWVTDTDDDASRNTAKSRLSKAVSDATGGAVKPSLRRVPGGGGERDRYYLRADIAAVLAPPPDTE